MLFGVSGTWLLTLLLLACSLIQFNLSGANDLRRKLLERNSPSIDLSLERGILLGLVGQVDGTAVVLQDLAFSIVRDVNVACLFVYQPRSRHKISQHATDLGTLPSLRYS